MATKILMKNPNTGIVKTGFYGYSWTILCWGYFPPFFRGDVKTGLLLFLLTPLTIYVAPLVWSFKYNKWYTQSLIDQGYEFVRSEGQNALAKQKLGIV